MIQLHLSKKNCSTAVQTALCWLRSNNVSLADALRAFLLRACFEKAATRGLLLFGMSLAFASAASASVCTLSLLEIVNSQSASGPGEWGSTGVYAIPSDAQIAAARTGVEALLAEDFSTAVQEFDALGLTVCSATIAPSSTELVAAVYDPAGFDSSTSRGMPVLAIRTSAPTASVIVSIPHSVTEWNVGQQGVELMESNPAVRALIVGTVHRCHLMDLAPDEFQGTTGECDGAYRASDMAHTQASLFHGMHEAFWNTNSADITLQIHGMGADGISVSAGTSAPIYEFPNRPALLLHDRMSAELETLAQGAELLTTCSQYDGPRGDRVRWHLCGTRNAQRAALLDLGRLPSFVHLEQSKAIRTNPQLRSSLSRALSRVTGQILSDGMER